MKAIYWVLGLSLCVLSFSCKKDSMDKETVNGNEELKTGLIAYYPFNGNAKDESGNGNNLEVNGAVITENRFGDSQKAYKFNGISDYMVIPGILKADSLRQLTISVWVKVEWLGHSSILSFLSRQPGTCSSYLGFDNSTDNFSAWHQMVTTATQLGCSADILEDKIDNPLDRWSHIVLVQQYVVNNMASRYTYTSYYNGKKLSTHLTMFDFNTIAASFSRGGVIGANNNSGNYSLNFDFFGGCIDDIRIYSRALSDDEVEQLYLFKEE